MDRFERLEAIEEIKALFGRRLRAMDQKDWTLYDTCHAEHAVLRSFTVDQAPGITILQDDDGTPAAVGKAAILEAIRTLLDGKTKVTTVHHAHTPEISLTSEAGASAIWAMEDLLWWMDGEAKQSFHGWGHYYETYEKIDGLWLIASRRLRRLHTESTPNFFRYLGAA